MVEIGILIAVGSGFAVAQIINNIMMLNELKKRENFMIKNMIKALETMEWRDDKE